MYAIRSYYGLDQFRLKVVKRLEDAFYMRGSFLWREGSPYLSPEYDDAAVVASPGRRRNQSQCGMHSRVELRFIADPA